MELRDELGLVNDEPKKVDKVDQAVNNYIFGGTNIIAGTAKDFTQVGSIQISKGDLGGFADALKTLGISQKHIEEATLALLADGPPKSGGGRLHSRKVAKDCERQSWRCRDQNRDGSSYAAYYSMDVAILGVKLVGSLQCSSAGYARG